jgi:CHAT domain-containing protein
MSDVIRQYAQLVSEEGSRPVIMLNACQIGRLGWHLTSIGGFAQSFIDRGAGVFVGSLWSVGDVPARHFSEAFYTALGSGETLAAAATAGRKAARGAGDGTYLAFVVYGAPHATMTIAKR